MNLELPSSLSELARLGFEDLSSTLGKLDRLVLLIGDRGHSALAAISLSASPDAALDGLLGLAASSSKPLSKTLAKPEAAERLCRVLGASDGLAEFLIRHPDALGIFAAKCSLPTGQEVSELAGLVDPTPQLAAADISALRDRIRIEYRRLLLRVADWDLAQPDFRTSIEAATAVISDLAGAALEASLALGRHEIVLEARFAEADVREAAISIIAMGKCGARELNYVSDVDVIFVAGAAGEQSVEIGTRLATRAMRNLDMTSAEPALWQVDANLRPEGKSGALVRTLDSHLAYYERWAENWEFQALLKARPIAGDLALGDAYIEKIWPLIWARPDRATIVDGVRRMRTRVLENIDPSHRDSEIKLGRGGLRDIEFTVQLLQLVHGVAAPEVRNRDTLGALRSLAAAGFLGRSDAEAFALHYQTLRALEHRVQLTKLRRNHLLPQDDAARRRVARGLGTGLKLAGLDELWQDTRSAVAKLHDSVFYQPLLSAVAGLEGEVRLTESEIQTRLEALGFTDPAGALRHIGALTSGLSRRSVIQRNLLPVLLRWLAEGVNPDRGLLAFRRLSEDLGETHWFLRMLRDTSGAAERLMRALSSSELVARLLEQIPESAAWLGSEESLNPAILENLRVEMNALIERHENAENAAAAVRSVRRREVLRLGLGAVLGHLELPEISMALSELTEAYLEAMLTLARREAGPLPEGFEFAVIAMGRLGGQELGFGSDADVMFVYRGIGADVASDTAEIPGAGPAAEAVAASLQALVKDQRLSFELDLDLRPEGKGGARVRSLESFAAYYQKWAEVWEFQALLRARFIAGDSKLGSDFGELIDGYRYPKELNQKQLVEIRRIKARVEAERLPQGADPLRHLKLGRGSISDVEWLIQLMQLRFANLEPAIRTRDTKRALQALSEHGHITESDREVLYEAWLIASRIRSAIVLANDRASDSLPADRRQLRAIARILEHDSGAELEEHYLAITRRARVIFEKHFFA